jgi:hypothetical protein
MSSWFPFFGRDFLAATLGWSAEERGHYVTLLIAQWEQDGLPADPKRLELISPHWRVMPARHGRIHEHQTPPAIVRRMIELYSAEGELVVDPFAGSGQVLRIARELGRNAIGYECDKARHQAARRALDGCGDGPHRGRTARGARGAKE